jgi:DNA-binding CsgD family transcriptional regulator
VRIFDGGKPDVYAPRRRKCRAMNAVAYATAGARPASAVTRRSDFSIALIEICFGIAAEHYMVLDTGNGSEGARILASNWVYDAIDMVGVDNLARLAQGRDATPLGGCPEPWMPGKNSRQNNGIGSGPESELARFGHNEIYALQLGACGRFVLFSGSRPGRIRQVLVSAAQFRCAYLLCEREDYGSAKCSDSPLSERERECLFWVAEGKTTDDVAQIVGVSPNTANRYISLAIRKLSAANRAKAVATAIRRGIL